MKRKTTETIIWLFCILVIVTLIVKIEVESKQYNCSNCTVKLFNTFAYGDSYKFGEYQIKELLEYYASTGDCLIKWDPNQGYYNG